MELKPRSKVPLTFPHYHHNEQLHIRSHTDWSLSIGSYGLCKPLSVLQKGYYQVKFLGDKLRTVTYADVEISIRNDMCYIVVKEPRRALFFFNNCTPFPMIPDSRCLAESENKKLNQYIKYQAASLYWDSPQEELEIAFKLKSDSGWVSTMVRLNCLVPGNSKVIDGEESHKRVSLLVSGENLTRIVTCAITHEEIAARLYDIKLSLNVILPSLEISFINCVPMEVVSAHFNNIDSGTPSNILPTQLLPCRFEPGSESKGYFVCCWLLLAQLTSATSCSSMCGFYFCSQNASVAPAAPRSTVQPLKL